MSRRFFTQYLGFGWGAFSAGGGEIWRSMWGGAFSTIGEGFSGRFKAPAGTPVHSAPDGPSLPTTEGMPPRGSQGPDEGDRRSGEVGRIDSRRIPPALIRSDSGQVGHWPWE